MPIVHLYCDEVSMWRWWQRQSEIPTSIIRQHPNRHSWPAHNDFLGCRWWTTVQRHHILWDRLWGTTKAKQRPCDTTDSYISHWRRRDPSDHGPLRQKFGQSLTRVMKKCFKNLWRLMLMQLWPSSSALPRRSLVASERDQLGPIRSMNQWVADPTGAEVHQEAVLPWQAGSHLFKEADDPARCRMVLKTAKGASQEEH